MKRFKIWTAVILGILTLIIILQNTEPVVTRILFFDLSMPRAILLFFTGTIGFLLGLLLSFKIIKKN